MPTTPITLTDDQIRGLLCSAFEGGSNYWYMVETYHLAEGLSLPDFRSGGKMEGANEWHPYELIPLVPGCWLEISELDDGTVYERYRLDRNAIFSGMHVMATKYPHHFADVIAEDDDATTGDVFLQCCLFGEVRYG